MQGDGASLPDDPGHAVRLRAATQDDWPTIRRWLAEPAIVKWWGPKATTEAEVMLALSSEHAIAHIIEIGGDAVGYAHALDVGSWGEALSPGLAPGSWDIDLFVASTAHRGRGVGARALELIRDEIFSTTLAPAAAIRISVGNERAVRACEASGFRWRALIRDAIKGPEWLMVAERPGPLPATQPRLL